jgi:hypothetical protein
MKLGCLASSNISKATPIKKVKGIPHFSFLVDNTKNNFRMRKIYVYIFPSSLS